MIPVACCTNLIDTQVITRSIHWMRLETNGAKLSFLKGNIGGFVQTLKAVGAFIK